MKFVKGFALTLMLGITGSSFAIKGLAGKALTLGLIASQATTGDSYYSPVGIPPCVTDFAIHSDGTKMIALEGEISYYQGEAEVNEVDRRQLRGADQFNCKLGRERKLPCVHFWPEDKNHRKLGSVFSNYYYSGSSSSSSSDNHQEQYVGHAWITPGVEIENNGRIEVTHLTNWHAVQTSEAEQFKQLYNTSTGHWFVPLRNANVKLYIKGLNPTMGETETKTYYTDVTNRLRYDDVGFVDSDTELDEAPTDAEELDELDGAAQGHLSWSWNGATKPSTVNWLAVGGAATLAALGIM